MAVHKTLPDSEIHEPLHIQPSTGADVGKVITPTGAGTSVLRYLTRIDVPEVDTALTAIEDAIGAVAPNTLSGVFKDGAMAATTIDVTIEEKQYYLIGALVGQTVTVQLPDPTTTTVPITVKKLDENIGSMVKVVAFSAELIEGNGDLTILVKGNAITLISDGTDWSIV